MGAPVVAATQSARRVLARLYRHQSAARRRLGRHFAANGDPVVLTDRYGIRFVLHAWELEEVDELLSKSFYKPDFRAVEKLLGPGDTAVDVGANVGTHSIMMARRVAAAGRVIAFEPTPTTASLMRENLSLNGVRTVDLVEAAISDAPGSVQMNVFDQRYSAWNSRGAPIVDGIAPVETIGVRSETLDAAMRACGVERINFLKIDVEGFELEALRGATGLLGDGAIDCLSFEISRIPLEASGHEASAVFDLLASFGYRSYKLDETSDRFVGPFESSDDFYINFYASRQSLITR